MKLRPIIRREQTAAARERVRRFEAGLPPIVEDPVEALGLRGRAFSTWPPRRRKAEAAEGNSTR